MPFDPAVAARKIFAEVQSCNELGEDLEAAVAAEECFSNSAGEEASEAYKTLLAIGSRRPDASMFKEFLVYITWSHLMDETRPEHFKTGLTLCEDLLKRGFKGDAERLGRLREMEKSFRAGLGGESGDLMDFDADLPKGGD